jgi:CHASE2 domain-containing sensor protein
MDTNKPSSTSRKPPGIFKFILLSFVITLLLCLGQVSLEHSGFWREYEVPAYRFLHNWVASDNYDPNYLPVVILDISKLEVSKEKGDVTPRDKLTQLLEAVLKQRPKAIAIDIDFSPNKDGMYVTDEDPKFFNYCLRVKKEGRVPIFLGVDEAKAELPQDWLGGARYKELAVALIVPEEDTRRIPLWLKVGDTSEQLPTLSAALSNAYGKMPKRPPRWLAHIIEMDENRLPASEHSLEDEGFTYADMLVNYSKLDAIEKSKINLDVLPEFGNAFYLPHAENLSDRLVIIGDADKALHEDNFNIEGFSKPAPGVYLHASAVYTLTTQPIYEFSHAARLIIDVLISVILILSIAFIRYRHRLSGDNYPWHKQQSRLTKIAAVIIPIIGILLVRYLSILWLNFGLVGAALLLHPKVEKGLHHLIKRFKSAPRPAEIESEEGA